MSVDEHHNPSLGAGRALALAIDMMRTASEVQMPNKEPVQLRIGAHTGPCVSGLMGVETPKWSVFGDTVNTASRMESHGYPMCIQISRATYDLLPKHVGVELQPSGGVAMKGKGVMETWVWRSPPDWTSMARESSGSTGRLPLSAERLYQFCYQPERAIRQPGSNPPSSLRLPHLKANKQLSLDETGEPNPVNLGHHPTVNRSTVAPLTESLAASLHRHRHTRTSSTMTTDLPSDTGFTPMAAMGRSRRDSVSNLQGLVMLVGGNDSGTGFARYASQKRESDGLPPTPFAITSQRVSCAEGPPEAQPPPPPPPLPAAEIQAAAPAVAAAAGSGSVGTGPVEAGAQKAGAAERSMEAGAEKLGVLGTLALETGEPEGGSSETGAHVVHTFADMPSKRHMASSSMLPPQHAALRDLEDPDNHGLATSPGDDNSKQAEFGARTSVLERTLQPQQQHHHLHHHLLQKPSTGTGQQQQARYFDHRAAALMPHPFPPQPRAPSSASSSSALFSPPFSPLQEESQTPGFAFPHIVLPLHDIPQADLTQSRSASPSRSPSSHTHVLRQQHHRDHPQQPPTPQVPASTTLRRPKKRASFLSRASWASEESQTDVDRGKSAGLPKINSSNTAGTTQDSIQVTIVSPFP
ncbi:hypothetical protein DUNSADRAFT_9305 [Dunaliella salina]|uniref:Guanylate cyclase domain-containing protein n=1 Tax=Dunaliella salina TaxID=3046 RepID=A0ABQ7GHQ3_DUNSA|nr:hypothetical protein DUNSADRAFT_9305 [Dunaliella salina]|eukprot:KAF5834144.1 hypothetical protein DUNSADRAFT_9305 [Dunaliella salina]